MAWKFYTSVAKELKLKVVKFWGLIRTFIELAGEKLVGEPFKGASHRLATLLIKTPGQVLSCEF